MNYLRANGHVALTRDAIADALKLQRVPLETPEYLNTAELARLLEACLRHDA